MTYAEAVEQMEHGTWDRAIGDAILEMQEAKTTRRIARLAMALQTFREMKAKGVPYPNCGGKQWGAALHNNSSIVPVYCADAIFAQ